MVGQGTGGYISYACATMDRFDGEMNLPKFIDPGCPDPINMLCSVIDTALSGDMYGLGMGTPNRALNTENHPGYSSEIHMAVNLGGALPDTSWLEAGDVPMVGLHNPDDVFAPYCTDWVIVPINANLVVVVSGTHDAIAKANTIGNNAVLCGRDWTDPYTMRANAINEGIQGLFPLILPTPSSQTWEWWDPTDPLGGCVTNDPTLSKATGLAYIDTFMNYVNPRIVCALDLLGVSSCPPQTASPCIAFYSCPNVPCCWCTNPPCITGIEDEISITSNSITIYPNPTNTSLTIHISNRALSIVGIELYNATGQLVRKKHNIRTDHYVLKRKGLPNGLYMIKVKTKEGFTMKKVVFE